MTHRRQRLTCYCDVISVITHSTSKWLITDHCFLRYLFVSSLFLIRVNDIVSRSNDTFSPPDENGRLTLLRSMARRAGLLFPLIHFFRLFSNLSIKDFYSFHHSYEGTLWITHFFQTWISSNFRLVSSAFFDFSFLSFVSAAHPISHLILSAPVLFALAYINMHIDNLGVICKHLKVTQSSHHDSITTYRWLLGRPAHRFPHEGHFLYVCTFCIFFLNWLNNL